MPDNETWSVVTRRGEHIARAEDGLRELRAGRRLDVDLHPRIENAVGPDFILGRFAYAGVGRRFATSR